MHWSLLAVLCALALGHALVPPVPPVAVPPVLPTSYCPVAVYCGGPAQVLDSVPMVPILVSRQNGSSTQFSQSASSTPGPLPTPCQEPDAVHPLVK